MTITKPPVLDALAEYFNIVEKAAHYEIRCKRCRKAWGLPVAEAKNFNPLGLFDHAFAHQETKK